MKPLFICSILLAFSSSLFGEAFIDDIYFTPEDAQREAEAARQKKANRKNGALEIVYIDNDAASQSSDTLVVASDSDAIEMATEGEYLNGFVGSDSDLEYANRIARFHNPKFAIHISDPGYTDIYFLDDDSWNVYIDGSYAYVTPTWTNPYYFDYMYSPVFYNPWAWRYNPYGYWGSYYSWYGYNWGWSVGWNYGWYNPWYDPYYYGWYNPYYPYHYHHHHHYIDGNYIAGNRYASGTRVGNSGVTAVGGISGGSRTGGTATTASAAGTRISTGTRTSTRTAYTAVSDGTTNRTLRSDGSVARTTRSAVVSGRTGTAANIPTGRAGASGAGPSRTTGTRDLAS